MFRFEPINPNKFLPFIVTLLLTGYQLARVIGFVNVYGGIEHDSGWFLGVSRSLAEQGTYTSLVSTLADPAVAGAIDVDHKFNIQTAEGRIWFFTGNGTGPASIIPNALILKLFGTSFWTLRAGPLIFYALLLIVTAYSLYQLAGLGAVVLFYVFLFCYPRLSICLSYEAMGEVTAMFYVVVAYLVFALALKKHEKRFPYFFLAGLIAGLAFNTKLLALLSISGIVIWAGWLCLSRSKRVTLRELVGLGIGLILPQAIWELIQLVILVRLANFELYLRHAQQRLSFVLDDGSGLGSQSHTGLEFMQRKFFMLEEVAHPEHWVALLIFAGILSGGSFLLWFWRRQGYQQDLLAPMWFAWLANTAWFVGLSKTGWPRHFWFGLMLAVMLLCVISVTLIRSQWIQNGSKGIAKSPFWLGFGTQSASRAKIGSTVSWFQANQPAQKIGKFAPTLMGMLFLGLMAWGFGSQPYVWGFFLPDKIVPYWLEKRFDYVDLSGLPWIIIPRADQAAVVDYINHMPPEANVYYPTAEFGHKAAEIPTLTGRIDYPFNRRTQPGVRPHPADILLVPPSIISIWRYAPVTHEELLDMVAQACPQPVLKNDNYIICLADQVRLP
ncbi:MAG: hypothetical protein HYR94_12555 [Chloroflexi bacterium]|nr:hypothetical protein [Chloroflexota bacterium]